MRYDLVRRPCEVMDSVMSGVDEQLVRDAVQTCSFEIVFDCEYRHFRRVSQKKCFVERVEETCIHDPAGSAENSGGFKRRSDFAADCPDCKVGAVSDDFGFSPLQRGNGQVIDL